MNFLNFTAVEAAIVALATLAAVLILFFLKLRHRRVIVGSALLWDRVLEDQKANSLIEKLRRWVSLLLAIVIALLIALAAGRPYLTRSDDVLEPVFVVVDTSSSMLAETASGQTRWDRAVVEARRIIEGANAPSGLMVADTGGQVRTPVSENRAELLAALERMEPMSGPSRFPVLGATSPRTFFITDGVAPPDELPADVPTISVFEAADNVAITAFRIDVDPTSDSGFSAFIEVTNFSSTAMETAVVITGVGGQRVVRAARLNPGDSWSEALDLDDFRGGGIQARIETSGDRFGLDDVAFGYLPVRGEVAVTLVTPDPDGYLATLLGLSPEVDLTVTAPDSFAESVATDVYVFEGVAPDAAPDRPTLVFGIEDAAWLPRQIGLDTDIQISEWDEEHPVMRTVPAYDLGIDRARVVDPGDRTVVATSGSTPLILIEDQPDRARRVLVTFDLTDSDFAFHLGFPIFVENVLAWFSGETLPEVRGLGEIELPAGTTALDSLDGTPIPIESRRGRPVARISEADLLTATVGGQRIRIAANMAEPAGSNINRPVADAADGGGALAATGNELWFYMLVLATMLILVEWWTYHRRVTL